MSPWEPLRALRYFIYHGIHWTGQPFCLPSAGKQTVFLPLQSIRSPTVTFPTYWFYSTVTYFIMNSLYTGSYWLATGIPLVTGSSDIQLVAKGVCTWSQGEFVLGPFICHYRHSIGTCRSYREPWVSWIGRGIPLVPESQGKVLDIQPIATGFDISPLLDRFFIPLVSQLPGSSSCSLHSSLFPSFINIPAQQRFFLPKEGNRKHRT